MNILHELKTSLFKQHSPLLDKEFDTKSQELADFICSCAQTQSDDIFILNFNIPV